MQQSESEAVAGAGAWGSVFVAVFIRLKGSMTIWKPFMGKLASSQYYKFALLTFWLVSSPSTAVETWETFAANHVKSRCNKSGCSGLVPTGKCVDGSRNLSLLLWCCSRIPAVLPQSLFPARFQPIIVIAFPLGNRRFPTISFKIYSEIAWMTTIHPPHCRIRDHSVDFLSLRSEPLIVLAVLSGRSSLCASASMAAEASFLFICLCPMGGWSVCLWVWGGGTWALLPGSCHVCAQAFPGSKSAELVTAEAMKRLWQMWVCSLILYEYWICFFFRGRVALCLRCCSLFIICRLCTILEWGVANGSSKVASWRYILAGEMQERTRKQKGSVGAMKMDPCCRPRKSFRSMF